MVSPTAQLPLQVPLYEGQPFRVRELLKGALSLASCSLGLGLTSYQGAGAGFPSQPLYPGYNQHCSPDQTPSATLPEGEHI